MNKRIVQEAAVGALSGLALVAGYIVLRSYLDDAKAGDWLQFAGAMLGTGLAVVGAVSIESWKRRREEQQGQATLRDVLNEMRDAFDTAAEPLTGDLNKDVGEVNSRRFLLEVAKDFAEFVLKQHLAPNSEIWRHTRGYVHYIDRILAVKWYIEDPVAQDDMCSDASIAHWHKSVVTIVDRARPILEREIETTKLVAD